MALRRVAAVAAGADDLDVAPAELRRFEDRLAAPAARRDGIAPGQFGARPVAARDRDPRDLVEPERGLRRGQRADLGAHAEPVAGVFHVGAGHDLAIDAEDRAADREVRIRRIGLERGGARGGDQLFVIHGYVSKRAAKPRRNHYPEHVHVPSPVSSRTARVACRAAPRVPRAPAARRLGPGRGPDPRHQRLPRQSRSRRGTAIDVTARRRLAWSRSPPGGVAYLAGAAKALRQGQRHSVTVSAGDMIGATPARLGLVPRRADDRRDEPGRGRV